MSEAMIAEQRAQAVKVVTNLLAQFSIASGHQRDASDALKKATDAAYSERENLFLKAADESFKGLWSDDAIKQAVEYVVANNNAYSDKKAVTLRRFASELTLAMDSKVRIAVPNLFSLGKAAWETETKALEANKKAAAPLRKAWSRRSLMLIALMRDVRKVGTQYSSAEAIVRFAELSDPAKDAEIVARKLKTMRANFKAFMAEFPVDGFDKIDRFFDALKESTLTAARDKANAIDEEPAPSNLRDPDGTPKAPSSDAPTDIVQDAINGYNNQAAA